MGSISLMYHRFDETKYPSTNIQMDVFKKQINIIKNNNFDFYSPDEFDLNNTINATANNGGYLDVKMRPERRNRIKYK